VNSEQIFTKRSHGQRAPAERLLMLMELREWRASTQRWFRRTVGDGQQRAALHNQGGPSGGWGTVVLMERAYGPGLFHLALSLAPECHSSAGSQLVLSSRRVCPQQEGGPAGLLTWWRTLRKLRLL